MLDPGNISVWKQLYRAAKAKQKLKLRVTLRDSDDEDKGPKPVTVEDEPEQESHIDHNKPDVSLITSAPSETDPLATEPSESSPAPAPACAEVADSRPSDERFAAAMARLQLTPQERDETIATTQKETTDSTVTTSSVCVAPKAGNFAVCCNNCDRTIPDVHYHCSTCDEGDFDLCPNCVEKGVICHNSDHWMVKRFVRGDFIVVSTTERVSPKPNVAPEASPAPALAVQLPSPPTTVPCFERPPLRTCNSCVQELPDKEFLHCTTCEDFDLCKTCFASDEHGHHPQHAFTTAVEGAAMPSEILRRLPPGRDQRHNAICDGCDKFIFGVRHKCLDCPDWDFCAACVVNSGFVHPNHRFVPIYEQMQMAHACARPTSRPCHYGICCDGPLCNGKRKSYIVGERFKCTVCHDTDFCASCEASPANQHNRTHPVIKFKTPVRRVEITTRGEDENGQKMPVMGDRLSRKPVSSRATGSSAAGKSTTTPLHTVVDVKPEPEKEVVKPAVPARARPSLDVQAQLEAKTKVVEAHMRMHDKLRASAKHSIGGKLEVSPIDRVAERQKLNVSAENLVAVFERDTIADGTVMPPNQVFEQTWVLRNGGDVAWPAGCSVKFVGGDYMGHVDSSHPAGIHDLVSASESTVCYDSVAPGQEFPFTVLLRTPAREGKVISWWRLTTKDGNKFGHRLWCDVTVQTPKAVEEAKQAVKEEVEQVPAAKEQVKTGDDAESSQMIFPKLEKESPEASFHEDTSDSPDAVEESDDFEECGEDDEWAEESEDGFLTDEEYDILDASDEEYLDEQHKKKVERK